MKIIAIVVIYNGMKNQWIHKCFSSILDSSVPVEIIAIDNNSNDGSLQYISDHFPQVTLLHSGINLGFGGANNLGMKEGLKMEGDYFFLLNQDATVEKYTVERLIEISQHNPEYAVISPIHLNGDGTKLDLSFGKSVSPQFCEGFYDDHVLGREKKQIYPSPFICAAAWLLPKAALQIVGGFSPAFFHYGEDDNYCHRVQYYNLKIGVVPNTYIYHDRENRPKSIYDERAVSLQRQYTLWCSNPTKHTDINKLLSQYRNKIIKYTLTGNLEEAKSSKKIHRFLKENKQIIIDSYKQSITEQSYKFIN